MESMIGTPLTPCRRRADPVSGPQLHMSIEIACDDEFDWVWAALSHFTGYLLQKRSAAASISLGVAVIALLIPQILDLTLSRKKKMSIFLSLDMTEYLPEATPRKT
jgi:hypothetical protein